VDAETRQQLYGGEISDYFKPKENKVIEQDNNSIADIYSNYVKNKKTLLDLLRFDPGKNFNDKL
jgi:hypothetical protein